MFLESNWAGAPAWRRGLVNKYEAKRREECEWLGRMVELKVDAYQMLIPRIHAFGGRYKFEDVQNCLGIPSYKERRRRSSLAMMRSLASVPKVVTNPKRDMTTSRFYSTRSNLCSSERIKDIPRALEILQCMIATKPVIWVKLSKSDSTRHARCLVTLSLVRVGDLELRYRYSCMPQWQPILFIHDVAPRPVNEEVGNAEKKEGHGEVQGPQERSKIFHIRNDALGLVELDIAHRGVWEESHSPRHRLPVDTHDNSKMRPDHNKLVIEAKDGRAPELWLWTCHSQDIICRRATPRLNGSDFSFQGLSCIWKKVPPGPIEPLTMYMPAYDAQDHVMTAAAGQ
ncbi:hypothetical protein JOM56_001751 [Amanita muscaria]